MVGQKHESQEKRTDRCVVLRRPWQFKVTVVIGGLDVVIDVRVKGKKKRKRIEAHLEKMKKCDKLMRGRAPLGGKHCCQSI